MLNKKDYFTKTEIVSTKNRMVDDDREVHIPLTVILEPIVVLWEGDEQAFEFHLPERQLPQSLSCHVQCENGETFVWDASTDDLATIGSFEVAGERYALRPLARPPYDPDGSRMKA